MLKAALQISVALIVSLALVGCGDKQDMTTNVVQSPGQVLATPSMGKMQIPNSMRHPVASNAASAGVGNAASTGTGNAATSGTANTASNSAG